MPVPAGALVAEIGRHVDQCGHHVCRSVTTSPSHGVFDARLQMTDVPIHTTTLTTHHLTKTGVHLSIIRPITTARSELWKVLFWRRQSVFFVCV